ncbi:hypothetical protein FEM48_Zijuj07G0058700 [Ziziphus jujuba var. spinosa]|uniref:Uncharacterized protein n=1 Tax=Ziziphus jujuba var. spinosa TaxID=714518 RepID=A0A978V2U8_ZIZJJ|nr:hypothetical protein FEM48_Zijuj07G0058700 [Ziziphus jujuba var. spinosa]
METRSLQNSAIFFLLTAFGLFGHCVAHDLGNIISLEDEVHVGVILDMGSKEGKIVYSCISMAVSDFYEMHNNYTARLHLHARDSKGKPLHALSAGKAIASWLSSITKFYVCWLCDFEEK